MMTELEDVPLDSSPSKSAVRKGYWSRAVSCTRLKLLVLIIVLVIFLLIIIILAALLGAAHKKDHDSHKESPTATQQPRPTTAGPEAWWKIRLPRDVVPVHYNLFLNVTVNLPRFDGNVEIIVNVTSPTDVILVHTRSLNVSHVTLVKQDNPKDSIAIKRNFSFKKNDFYVIQAQSPLRPGLYVVKMQFAGFFSPDLRGLYRSSYKKMDGKISNFAATQFEAVRARSAFPCMDEPALKATFNVTIAHRKDNIALSNMPIYRHEVVDGQEHDHFLKTVVMPTYLLAFVVGEFKYRKTETKNGVEMRIYSRPSLLNHTLFAAVDGNKSMTFFEEYFDIKYILSKADMIALPDFGPGAMENWGLITYREKYLLWDSSVSSEYSKMTVASIIAHELAHQWFGNIVTMKWWDDLWLNEGFASYMAYKGVEAVHPSWRMEDRFIGKTLHSTMLLDGLASSHPIKANVNSPSEIGEIFDKISYGKGASVLRMLESFLGSEVFRKGLTRYLRRYAFSNAETDDLWQALEEESCKRPDSCIKVKHVMDTWTLQMGYPVITLTKHNASAYLVTQKHFLFDKTANVSSSKYKSPFNYKWVVPFTFVSTNIKQKKIHWMEKGSIYISDSSPWIKGNQDHKGYYIVNYDASNWRALKDQLNNNHTVLKVGDRAGLVFDAFILARGGDVSYDIALDITTYMNKETALVPWTVLYKHVNNLKNLLSQSNPAYKRLQKYLMHQGKGLYDKLGFSSSGTHLEIFQRRIFLQLFCDAGEPSCINNATQRFTQWMNNPSKKIDPNLRELVLTIGVAQGGIKEWEFVYQQYKTSEIPNEQTDMMKAMASSKEPFILSRYLDYVMDPTKFSKNKIRSVYGYIAANPIGNRVAWDFIRLNWSKLQKKFGSERYVFYRMVPMIAQYFTTEYELGELLQFSNGFIERTGIRLAKVQQTIDEVRANIKWYKNNVDTIDAWLKKYITDNKI